MLLKLMGEERAIYEVTAAFLNLAVSLVRSLTLDVKVWEPTILDLFCTLGNSYCNSVWEEGLLFQEGSVDILCIQKPHPKDDFMKRERYIHAKYVEKILIVKEITQPDLPPLAVRMWEAVKTKNIKEVYRLIVTSNISPNTGYDEVNGEVYHHDSTEKKEIDPSSCPNLKASDEPETCLQGCTLLHLVCHVGDPVMLELLLQFGGDINIQDFHGRTPLHHCILKRNDHLAKFIIRRGARTSAMDGGGLTALERAMEGGAITDEELFILLAGIQ